MFVSDHKECRRAGDDAPAGAPRLWLLSDGKIGDDVQCRAIAGALGASFEKRLTRPRAPWSWVAHYGVLDPRDRADRPGSAIHGEPPDVAIASGRRAVAYAKALKAASGGRTKIVFLKDPRRNRHVADMIWAPAHDRLTGANDFSTLTSPHPLSAAIAARRAALAAGGGGARPVLGVVLGGGAGYSPAAAGRLAAMIASARAGYARIAVTPSRRTPAAFMAVLREHLQGPQYSVWDGTGGNPYVDILAGADALIVGADSHNMMSEAAATGAGVYAWRPQGLAKKLDWFVGELERKGAVRPFEGAAPVFSHPPIDATPQIAAEIRRRLSLS